MRSSAAFRDDRDGTTRTEQVVWIALIVIAGTCLSTFFACVTPFAALATLAALKLSPRNAVVVMSVVWAANQAIGYGFLGYPWTWDSGAWGLAIGASAGLALLAARALSTTRAAPLVVSLPFIAAFATFELGLYGSGFMLPSSAGAFAAAVVAHVFLINAVALCLLLVTRQVLLLAQRGLSQGFSDASNVGAASFR